jgi:hypothetical protein
MLTADRRRILASRNADVASEPLIERGQRGDRDAIAELYELYVERIFRFVSYRVDNTGDAEDLTAEVFVKMVEGLPGYRPKHSGMTKRKRPKRLYSDRKNWKYCAARWRV